uniref:abnormal spindle-like microcephaly-associated protein n=1 Tax=Jaculus jaculus TaxID=51337 RepID=UPI001E1B5E44|nr:abnormal spindle-like microcephaly-associated protein [Jaculus jaculus]
MATPRVARGGAGSPASEASSPPVLALSHFCGSPFVSFGAVRVGAARTRALVLHNPHEEALAVELSLRRAAGLGFSVWPRRCELQPKEKITLSISWTPLKEGRVREIVTFLVNDILKHQAILLGNAEEPKKKKRSLWNTINKKKFPASRHNKKISKIQNVNETFNVSQNFGIRRSPLQACENLAMNESYSPLEKNSLTLEENKISISPISPTFKEGQNETCLPLHLRRSTAYSSLYVSDGEQLKVQHANILKDINYNEEVITKTYITSINLSGQSEENCKIILTPNGSPTLNTMHSQGKFLSPDSFVNNSRASNNEVGLVRCLSSDTFMKENSKSLCLESKAVHEVCRTILSPDSFLNDNYGLNQDLKSGSDPILSPSQFVKDNMVHRCIPQHTCKVSTLSNKNSGVPQSSQGWRKNEALAYNRECQHFKTPKVNFEEQKPIEVKSDKYSFRKQSYPKSSESQVASHHSSKKQPKRRPILSATVTKRKPYCVKENQGEINKPKAKRCLNSIVGEYEKTVDNQKEREAFHSYLPVIKPVLSEPQSYKHEVTPTTVARKRKSDINTEDSNMKVAVTEHTEVYKIKRIHFSPLESRVSTVTKTKKRVTPVSKYITSREKLSQKKKIDSLLFKTPVSKTKKRTKPIVAVAQSNLTFIKPLKTDIPRHPVPFAAKNMFYDERWKEKQEQGFTWWLNFILTPDDFSVKTNVPEVNAATLLLGVENQHKLSVPRAPTKDEVSLRTYTARCRLNRLRRTAYHLFTSENMVKAIKKLEIEIEVGRLIVRKDRHLWKDIGERQKVLNWLLSYNPLWLRIGLETVYGELISLVDNSDVTGLAVFILNRLLWNPDIAAEYRHPTVPHLYRDGHEEALSKFTLKKLLLLVCFLDHAKNSRLIDHDPCLFCKDAEFKASKELLLAFSRDFLSGEGDLSRHLSLLGLPVSHVQTPLDEFDFAVTNLAVDLQCGVRLVRTMELLTQNWNLSKKLRIPAISRLQKMHNVDIVLQILKSRGIQLCDEHGSAILSKDIVDRHREKTLALLWKIAFAFQVDISLNLDQLKEEIDFLRRTHGIIKAMSALSCHSDSVPNKKKDKRNSGSFEQYSDSVKLLMDWVNAVCAFYDKKVENFTVSFSDGRVLCYLIHHYHPCYVPYDAICQRTTQSVECAQTGSILLNSSSESDGSCLDLSLEELDQGNVPKLYKELLENEKKNFHLVRTATRDLGGIPAMIHHSDMSNTIPDEKVVITYVSFLCTRLLDLRKEIRAARLIQTMWRKYKLKRDLKCHQKRNKAARIIQSAIRNFLTRRWLKKEVNAVLIIQKYWRRVLAQRKLLILKQENMEKLQKKSALLIQVCWRRYFTRKQFLKLKYYSIILQSRIRMVKAVRFYRHCLWAIVTIQRHWRACLIRKEDQQRYQLLKSSSLIIQSAFRRWKWCKLQLQTKAAITLQRAFRQWRFRKDAREKSAVVIQSWYRMSKEVQRYLHARSCVIVIQRRVRCFQAQKLYKRRKESVLTIQRYFRAYLKGKLVRTDYLQKRAAAIRLQAAFRGMKARTLHRQIRAACVLQSYWKMRQERLGFLNLKKMVIKLQALVRKHQQLQKYEKMRKAAIIIQTHFRSSISARKVLASYQKTRSAVIVLQSAWRGMQARKMFIYTLTSVIKIQSYYRAYISRRKFQSLRNATIKLQSIVKMKQARKEYLHLRASALFIQWWYRSHKLGAQKRKEYVQMREACVKVQAFVRGHLIRKQMRLQRKAAVFLQSYFRMRRARLQYLKVYKAALVIQSSYCAYRAGVNQRKNFLQVKRAAICLQAAYRGYQVRQLIKHQSVAAVKIQTAFRGYSERMKYQCVLQATMKIQRWYRAHKTACDIRTQFLKSRAVVISLQSAYRGWKVRKQLTREHEAAMKIQSAFRMVKAKKQFQMLKAAALVIQRQFRAWTAGKKQRMEYIELLQAVLVLQATWKGKEVRKQIQRWHKCAVIIQSCYRMHVQQKKWKIMKKAAFLIQMHYRAYQVGKEQHHLYLKTRAAVIILQAAYRGMKVRKRIKNCQQAAVTIQSKFRAYKTQKKYTNYRTSAIIIQRWYRNIKVTTQQHKEYLNLKKAAIKIQAVFRGIRVRRHIQYQHMAATSIKAMFKMYQSRVRYHTMRRAAIVIQVRYRAYCQGKIEREQYLSTLKAIRTVQAGFRRTRVRQAVIKRQVAATLIQSYYRTYRQQTFFNKLKKATKIVQQRYRAVKERNIQFESYRRLRHSVICIQAAFRGMKTRRQLKVMHLAATHIQRKYRTLMIRRKFLYFKNTVICIQRKYRANRHAKYQLQQFLLQTAVLTIQSSYRGWVVRKRVQEMHRAATLIQAIFRMHRALIRYQAMKRASIVVQRQFQVNRAAKLQRQHFIRQRHAAVIIQAAFRGMKTRSHMKSMHSSATLIQSRFRALVIRRRFLSLKKAAVFVQRKYRATVCAKHALHQFLELRKAAIVIQSFYRRLMVMKRFQEMHEASVLIQAAFRMHRAYVKFHTWKCASIVIQQHYRTYKTRKLQREKFTRQWHSAVIIQAAYKGMKVRQILREKYRAAIIIQSTYRMYRHYHFYQKLRWTAKVIQEKYRANKVKQKALQNSTCKEEITCIQASFQDSDFNKQIQREHEAAIIIQKHFKAFKIRRHYRHLRLKVLSVQRGHRALPATHAEGVMEPHRGLKAEWRKCKAKKYLHKVKAACMIQAWYRCWRARREYLAILKAVKIIESCFCAKLERARFLNMRASAIILQRKWRAILSERIAHEDLIIKRHRAACLIQAYFRGSKERQVFLQQKYAAVTIQRYIRAREAGKCERMKYIELKKSTILLQGLVRGWLVRKRILEEKAKIRLLHFTAAAYCHLCALRIQRAYKLYIAVKNAKEHIHSVICIQRWFRTRLQQKRLIEQYPSITETEHEVQQYQSRQQQNRAASVIQKAARRLLLRKSQEKLNSRITKIQALWRGFSWRKKNDCTKIRAIRLSLQAVNRNIEEENKLYKRTARALHYLLTYKHLSAILDALKHLEVVTRLSPRCCENMAESGAISKVFVVIRSCNRSVPCMEVIKYAVQVLLNVAKYENTASAVYDADSCVDTLLELLQMYREKPGDKVAEKSGSIFTKTCCLLAVLLRTRDRASDVRSRSKVVDRIYSLYKFTAHKHKISTERTLDKQKQNLHTGFSFIPETPVRTRIVSRLKPHWVLGRDNMEEITNSLQAIQMVMDTLGIPY